MSRLLAPLTALSLACALPLPAAATGYFYTIHDVTNPYLGTTPGASELTDFTGLFEGTDSNGDSVISLSELTLFSVGLYVNAGQLLPSVVAELPPSCIPNDSIEECTTHSHMDSFSYDMSTGAFEAEGINPNWPDGAYIETGTRVGYSGPAGTLKVEYLWTPQTYVTVRPVPEPETWTLMAAGLLGLGGACKLQRRRAARDKAQEPHAHA